MIGTEDRQAAGVQSLDRGVELTAEQRALVDTGGLEGSSVLCVPTSWGKTWMAKLAIKRVVAGGLRAVYLCPLVALAKELGSSWRGDMAPARVGVYTGEVSDEFEEDNPSARDADVLIATPEKLDWFLRQWESNLCWLAQVDLLVVDELHNLGGGQRGATLEGVIARMRAINPFVRVMGLSATLGNAQDLGRWLGASVFESRNRPVPLAWSIEAFKSAKDKEQIALAYCSRVAGEGAQTIVFVQSRVRAQALAEVLAGGGLRAAAHHAGLSKSVRGRVEAGFRQRQLDTIVSTPTLSQGVNLPAKCVLVYDLTRWDAGGWSDLSCSEVWQLAGRAGRKGLDNKGEVVLLAPKWDQTSARRYLKGQFEPIKSQVHARSRSLCEQILVVFGSRLASTQQQACRVMAGMFMAVELNQGRQSAGASKPLEDKVAEAVSAMVAAGMLRRDDEGKIKATRLGRIAVRFQLSPETVIAWAALVAEVDEPTFFDLLLAVCASRDMNGALRSEIEDLQALQAGLDAEASSIKVMQAKDSLRMLPVKGRSLVGAVKGALALRAWTRLGDFEEAGVVASCQAHEVEELKKEALRMLQAMSALVASGIDEGAASQADGLPRKPSALECKLMALRAMVSAGLDDEQATLAMVDGIGPVLARRLIAAGVNDIEDLALADVSDLAAIPGVSGRRAEQWLTEAAGLVELGGAFRFREVHRAQGSRDGTDEQARARRAEGLDYFRWLRAGELSVASARDGAWSVEGGAQEHIVAVTGGRYACDCLDASKGRLCKHVIAVRHEQGDVEIPRFDAEFEPMEEGGGGRMDLFSLWGERS